jgi:hypothetical protein
MFLVSQQSVGRHHRQSRGLAYQPAKIPSRFHARPYVIAVE